MTTKKKPSKQSGEDWKPKGYHRRSIRFLLQNSGAALFLDPGLGKTSIVLAAIKVLKKDKMACKTLVIAPLRPCYLVWPAELKKWNDFHNLKMVVLHGKDKDKNLHSEADIYVINPDGLPWLMSDNRFKSLDPDILVVDESSKFKRTTTQRFKLLRPVLAGFARRWILTGSPAPNGLMDIFGQIYILDLGKSLGRYVTHYRSQYFYPSGFGGYDWKLQEGAEARIQTAIKPLVLRLEAEDHIDLPKEVLNSVMIQLPKKATEIYREMEKELVAYMNRDVVTAASSAVASGKCSQIANGGVYNEERKIHNIHEAKIDAVMDLVEELQGSPVLVAYEYGHDLERLQKALGKSVPNIGGGTSPKRSAEIEAAWNGGEIPVLLGQPAAMGHGLNLQKAGNHIIWHSLVWNFEDYDQFNRRIRRQGSAHDHVYIHHIIAADTIDEAKMIALSRKNNTQKGFMNAFKDYLSKRNNITRNRVSSSFTSPENESNVFDTDSAVPED